MKKHIGVKIVIMIAAAFLISASKPSLDGRALVASSGELPPGLYVKAAAFLPGDTVLITNPAAKVSIEALVFGTFSPSEGVAVILSPEAADVLLITKDSNSIVQLTKSGGDTEHSVLAKAFDKASPPVSAEEPADDSVPYENYVKSEAPAKTEPVTPEVQDGQTADVVETAEASVPIAQEPEPIAQTDTAETVSQTEVASGEAASAEVTSSEVTSSEAASVEASSPEESFETEQVFTPFADIASSKVPEPESAAENSPAEIPAETAELSAVPEEEPSPIAVSEAVYDEPLVETTVSSASDTETPIDEQPAESEVPLYTEAEQPLYTETEIPETEEAQSLSEPNILITAEDNPPVFEESVESDEDFVAPKNDLPDYFTSSQEDEASFNEKPLYSENIYFDTDSHLIDGIDAFGKGSYCIQLATYKNKAYIAEVFEKYGDKYPIRLLKSEKIPEAYQVLIGPLNKDEYPVILKRFVSRGFKDAFVRSVR
ncbi:MAG: hypothetical protein ACTTKC_00930 [Treponema sp.]|uniref:hypothetical protein n=1 Tax=Treponema sp. TaxID=166 RepID=UPI003FA33711